MTSFSKDNAIQMASDVVMFFDKLPQINRSSLCFVSPRLGGPRRGGIAHARAIGRCRLFICRTRIRLTYDSMALHFVERRCWRAYQTEVTNI